MKTPHKHAAVIKAWADGEEIQVYVPSANGGKWEDLRRAPTWESDKYRIKPKPESSLTKQALYDAYLSKRHPSEHQLAAKVENSNMKPWFIESLKAVADAAVQQHVKEQQK